MATESVIQRAFAGGELAPALAARADQAKYQTGLASCWNFLVRRHGGVTKRPGSVYVAATKANGAVKLIPFIFEGADQTYLIEAGAGYFRFYWHGAPVVVSGVAAWDIAVNYLQGDLVLEGDVYYYAIVDHTGQAPPDAAYWYALTDDIFEVPNPYAAEAIPDLQFTQSADVLTLAHPDYVPYELQRLDHTTWRLVAFTTEPSLSPPQNLLGTAGLAGVLTARYVVTAAREDTFEESYASDPVVIANTAPPTAAAPNVVTWDAVEGAAEYYVYADPYGNGIYGFIGAAQEPTFNDVGFLPDQSITPPIPRTLFDSDFNYPSLASYYQQRLLFAHSTAEPETVWGSQVGGYHNFSISTPLQDDDAVTFVLAGTHLNPVRHLVGLKRLIVLTDEGAWIIRGDETGALRPTSINADQVDFHGASAIRPVVIGNALLFVQARGSGLRDLKYDFSQGDFAGKDLTIYASHLFEGETIIDLAYAEQPHSILWAVRADGVLLGLTYLPDQEVWGWHRHTFGGSGVVEAVAVLPDTSAGEDVVYLVIRRTIDGGTVRYIERLASLQIEALADAVHVDSALTYEGAAATTITGLDHLEGESVKVLGDGAVVAGTFTVASGAITLPAAVSVAQVGLVMPTPELETLELDVEGTAVRDKRKRVQSLTILVEATTHGILVGPDRTHLVAERPDPWASASERVTGQQHLTITAAYTDGGQIVLQSPDPVPCTVLGILPHLELGR